MKNILRKIVSLVLTIVVLNTIAVPVIVADASESSKPFLYSKWVVQEASSSK